MDSFESMKAFLAYHRNMFGLCIVVSVMVTVVLAVVKADDLSWAGGFAAGSLAQLFKFGFVDVNVIRKIAVAKEGAAGIQLKAMFFSLAIFAVAVLAVHSLKLNVWAMAAGIFLPRLILVADTYIRPDPFKNAAGPEDDGAKQE